MDGMRAYLAEFIGTFALCYVGVGAIYANAVSGGAVGLVGIALAHGLTIAVMVSATGHLSGGHVNPAVTFGFLVAGRIAPGRALGYLVAQLGGATAAGFLVAAAFAPEVRAAMGGGTPVPAEGVTAGTAVLVEAVLTFFLVFVVFGTAVDPRAPRVGGLFIGLTVALDILMGGPLTGAAMNPARTFGPGLAAGVWTGHWIYWVGPLLGGGAAALVYERALMPRPA